MTSDPVVIIGAGQSGLAAAKAAETAGLEAVVLEASESPAGSWPSYYDSLTLFSPARYSGFPGTPFPGDPDRYPTRDEVVAYLENYATTLKTDIRLGARVVAVEQIGRGFAVHTAAGDSVDAAAVIAATGSFARPYVPVIQGREVFGGEILHVADYRDPKVYAEKRVVVVGAGNSAIQVAYELAEVARVTLAVRRPVQFVPQIRGGRDMHYWLHTLRLDLLPPSVLSRLIKGTLVFDTGIYGAAIDSGDITERPMFTAYDRDGVLWSTGEREPVDVVLFATGYRPNLPYLAGLGALDPSGSPLHKRGISLTHRGLAYLGLEFQRSFSSNTLRGVHRDARFVIKALKAQS